jgi:regulation of enolase protein 1 (concanavalin A-like superfamily)
MRLALTLALCLTGGAPALAQATDDLSALSDEFNSGALEGWTRFDQAHGWPDKIKVLDVGATTAGALHLEPYHSAWVRDLNAPFLFKTVQGDFDVRARVRVKGLDGDIAGGTWSLGGLMARTPNRNTAADWRPRMENWHFITTGVGHLAGEQMTETKSTFNSWSSLKLRPFAAGWVELRLVRVGVAMIALARPDGETRWQVRDRFYRMNAPDVAEVGLIAYTTSPDVAPAPENPVEINGQVNRDAQVDMALEADWIRFSRPRLTVSPDWYGQVSANPLADPNLTEADLLALIGD